MDKALIAQLVGGFVFLIAAIDIMFRVGDRFGWSKAGARIKEKTEEIILSEAISSEKNDGVILAKKEV